MFPQTGNTMLTGRQIRAARSLTGMNQTELAALAGMTPQGILKIEDGSVQPREGTLADIQRVFAERRIEFTDNEGVRFRPEGVEVLNGEKGLEKFSDNVFAFAQLTGGIIRQVGIEENAFEKYAHEVAEMHRKRMFELVKTKNNIQVKAILQNGDYDFISSDYAEYRWYPPKIPAAVPYYIFGDTVCIFTFDTDSPPKIVLITCPAISLAYCKQFDDTWSIAKAPPPDPKKKK